MSRSTVLGSYRKGSERVTREALVHLLEQLAEEFLHFFADVGRAH